MRKSTKIDSKVIKLIRRYSKMAPLHNPANLAGIEACSKLIPEAEQVAVFDTAFHSDIPERARIYPIPIKYYRQGIMRYGFHGISHKYACMRAAQILRRDIQKMKIISCHLGGGSSVSAVLNGRCIDTSMGFTPLEGLMMATRSGDIDPGIILYLLKKGIKEEQLDEMLNKKSGFLGIMESSSDFRDILAGIRRKNKKAILAFEIFAYRISKYIGAYAAALNGVDAIVFTGGIGQNSGLLREAVLKNLEFLGVKLDGAKNLRNEQLVSAKGSRVAVVVVKADEEQMIAEETERVLKEE
jgi:acetate kinase